MPRRPKNLVAMREIIGLLTRRGVRQAWGNIKRAVLLDGHSR